MQTSTNAPFIDAAARRYGVAAADLTPMAGGHATHVYSFTHAGKDCVLRITPPNEDIDLPAMRAILPWMHYLAAGGASVAAPAPAQSGNLIETIEQDGQTYIAVAFERAPGIRGEELTFDQWNDVLFARLGQTAGKMHALAKTYTPPSADLTRPTWDAAANCYHPSEPFPPSEAIIAGKQARIVEAVRALPKDRDSYGMIHADLHGGNFFVDVGTNTITVFDFDDCSYGWYVMDIAMSVFDMLVLYPGADKEAFAARFLQSYLRGYRAENTVSTFWLGQLPHFLKLLEIGVYAEVRTYYDPADTDSWVGWFMANRKARIENDVPYVTLDFAQF
ncbi:MAG TPA: phosphotransferase [Anaerolineae bacterium]|nr:phosphotransferase [Anaerolineae bacterium]HQI85473.1 phosphotransferase [Anaerolineae bacterium]